jgi:hypothetical protein
MSPNAWHHDMMIIELHIRISGCACSRHRDLIHLKLGEGCSKSERAVLGDNSKRGCVIVTSDADA